MSTPADPENDRRAVPRHLRDGENAELLDTAASGIRRTDAAGSRAWIYVVAVLLAAAAVAWFALRP